jgi:ATPase subunit of ABC transporter with duplicated ATPase domains
MDEGIKRGEVQRGSIRLYHASCRQSGSAETSYSEKYLAEFLPGAKIGVLGLNGAGKSTLLRIMAGIDTDIEGEARPQPGLKIGYLPQEPQLNPEQTVRESVEEAVSEVVNALKGLDEVYAKYAEPDADFDKLAATRQV